MSLVGIFELEEEWVTTGFYNFKSLLCTTVIIFQNTVVNILSTIGMLRLVNGLIDVEICVKFYYVKLRCF